MPLLLSTLIIPISKEGLIVSVLEINEGDT